MARQEYEILFRAIDDLSGQLRGIRTEFNNFSDTIKKTSSNISTDINKIGQAFKMFVGLPVTLLGVGLALKSLTKETFAFGSQIKSMSSSMGISIEEFLKLRTIAIRTGTDLGILQLGFYRIATGLSSLKDGTLSAQIQFEKFGISYESVISGTIGSFEAFQKIADYFSTIENKSKRTAIAIQTFGRGGSKLVEVLLEMKKAGQFKILDEETIKNLDAANTAINEIVEGLKNIARTEVGSLVRLIRIISGKEGLPEPDFIKNIEKLKKEIQEIQQVIGGAHVKWTEEEGGFLLGRTAAFPELPDTEAGLRARLRMLKEERDELVKQGKIILPDQQEKLDIYEKEKKLKESILDIEYKSSSNLEEQINLLEVLKRDYIIGKEQWFEIQKIIDGLKLKQKAKEFEIGWTGAMNYAKDTTIDWSKTLIKTVDEFRQAFSDAFYSIGELLITHTNTWQQILRKFYQSIAQSIGKSISDELGKQAVSGMASLVGGAGGAGGMATLISASPYIAAAAAVIAVATEPARRRKEAKEKWEETKEINRQREREKARIYAEEYAKAMEKADLKFQSAFGGLGTKPVTGAEDPEIVAAAMGEARAYERRASSLAILHAAYVNTGSKNALRYYEQVMALPMTWWIDLGESPFV